MGLYANIWDRATILTRKGKVKTMRGRSSNRTEVDYSVEGTHLTLNRRVLWLFGLNIADNKNVKTIKSLARSRSLYGCASYKSIVKKKPRRNVGAKQLGGVKQQLLCLAPTRSDFNIALIWNLQGHCFSHYISNIFRLLFIFYGHCNLIMNLN